MRMIDFQALPNVEVAHQSGSVGTSAVTLLSLLSGGALHAKTEFVRISTENDDMRLTVQTTTPTGSLGTLITAGSWRVLSRAEAENAKMIRTTSAASDVTVQIEQFKA